jgi:pilus assembly protein CpaB
MRNKRLIVVLVGAVVFGLIAAVSVGRYLSNAQGFTRGMNKVVVAKVDIPAGEQIVAEQLTTASFPATATPDGVFDSPEKLVGRVSVVQIAAREPVTDFKLAAEGSVGGLGATIPEGYRAMAVKVDDVVGVSGFLKPGAMVDVLTVIQPTSGSATKKDPVAKIVLQNVKVLTNGQNMDKPKNEREAESVRVVTLQVTPEQAEKLALAAVEGKLRLVMRNTIDQGDEQTPGADKNTLLTGERAMPAPEPGALKSEQPKPAPAPVFHKARRAPVKSAPKAEAAAPAAPAPPRPAVEMIQGTKRSTVEFP